MPRDNSKSLSTPPYISFRTFKNFLMKFEQDTPSHIDRSYLNKSYSGATGSQLLTTLRFLGLIEGESNRVTAELYRLAEEKDAQKEVFRQLLYDHYASVFVGIGDLSKATHGELERVFTQLFGVDSDTRRKAISFFIHAAQEAEIPISKYIRTSTNPIPRRAAFKSTSRRAQQRNVPSLEDYTTIQKLVGEDIPSFQAGSAKTITLRKRESLILIYTDDVVNMDRKDRTFFFHLVDEMTDYAQEIRGVLSNEDTEREERLGSSESPL